MARKWSSWGKGCCCSRYLAWYLLGDSFSAWTRNVFAFHSKVTEDYTDYWLHKNNKDIQLEFSKKGQQYISCWGTCKKIIPPWLILFSSKREKQKCKSQSQRFFFLVSFAVMTRKINKLTGTNLVIFKTLHTLLIACAYNTQLVYSTLECSMLRKASQNCIFQTKHGYNIYVAHFFNTYASGMVFFPSK